MDELLTTGQVAKLLNVAPRTVSKWFDAGKIQGQRLPNGNRLIPRESLKLFCQEHNMPCEGLEDKPDE